MVFPDEIGRKKARRYIPATHTLTVMYIMECSANPIHMSLVEASIQRKHFNQTHKLSCGILDARYASHSGRKHLVIFDEVCRR